MHSKVELSAVPKIIVSLAKDNLHQYKLGTLNSKFEKLHYV